MDVWTCPEWEGLVTMSMCAGPVRSVSRCDLCVSSYVYECCVSVSMCVCVYICV